MQAEAGTAQVSPQRTAQSATRENVGRFVRMDLRTGESPKSSRDRLFTERRPPLLHAALDVREDLLLVLLAGVDDLEHQHRLLRARGLDRLDHFPGIDASRLVGLGREGLVKIVAVVRLLEV